MTAFFQTSMNLVSLFYAIRWRHRSERTYFGLSVCKWTYWVVEISGRKKMKLKKKKNIHWAKRNVEHVFHLSVFPG